jgi:hypothetical protein
LLLSHSTFRAERPTRRWPTAQSGLSYW